MIPALIAIAGIGGWVAVATVTGLVVGRAIRIAGQRDGAVGCYGKPDWLADAPAEVLSQTEIDRRFTLLASTYSEPQL